MPCVPLTNPDGGEVRRRTNEAGYDMNRDYVKLESQEIHALVTQVMNEWTPDIHVDGHHGGSAPYVITYQGTLNPAADAELNTLRFLRVHIVESAEANRQVAGRIGKLSERGRFKGRAVPQHEVEVAAIVVQREHDLVAEWIRR